MTTKTYRRPAGVAEEALLDALFVAGAAAGIIGTGNPDMIGLSIEGTSDTELDEIWRRTMLALSDRTDQLRNEQ